MYTAALGTAITTRTMLELPLNARNFFDLVALTPGATKVAGGSSVMDGRSIQIGGIRNTSTEATLDGAEFTVANVFNPAIALALDSLQEFKVQTNNLNAEWGRFAGGVINFTTKSGSNKLHGAAYEYLRNTVLNANNFFSNANGVKRSPFHQNQYGLNAGGPVFIPHVYDGRNKTFFFASFEGRRERRSESSLNTAPNAAWLQGDFVEKGGWAAVVPASVDAGQRTSAVAKACAVLLSAA